MRTRLSFQSLEVFETVARTASLQGAARDLGLSTSSVSHHLGRLERELGTTLIDRTGRPLRLTPEGRNFVLRIREGLSLIRQAQHEVELGQLSGTRRLRLGLIDDFEGAIGPAVALDLARALPQAALTVRTITSLEAPALLAARQIDMAVIADPDGATGQAMQTPILRDPFVMAVRDEDSGRAKEIARQGELPILRFSPRLLIGRQIDGQLRRVGLPTASRHEFDDAASILSLVAAGHGWAIVTPAVVARTHRQMDGIALSPLPFPAFARHRVLIADRDMPQGLVATVAAMIRKRTAEFCVTPGIDRFPWLDTHLRIEGIEPDPS